MMRKIAERRGKCLPLTKLERLRFGGEKNSFLFRQKARSRKIRVWGLEALFYVP
jgi:hypothetical protein